MLGHQLGLPVLYSFRRCPYAMRARLALVAAGVQVEIREILLRDKPQHLRDLSPKATVPVLWLPDGTVIDQSLDVMRWALAQRQPVGFLTPDTAEVQQGEQWLQQLDGPFKFNLDRYKYPNRYENCDPVPHRAACLELLLVWEQALADGRAFLFGTQPSLYDAAILPFVRQFRIADEAWFDSQTSIPSVQAWLNQFLGSSWFDLAMPKLAPWQPGDPPLIFPA